MGRRACRYEGWERTFDDLIQEEHEQYYEQQVLRQPSVLVKQFLSSDTSATTPVKSSPLRSSRTRTHIKLRATPRTWNKFITLFVTSPSA